MANVPESPTWVGGIYQLETTDKVRGGAGGIANRQAEQLANRTSYLNGKVEELGTNKQDKSQPSESAEKLSTPRNITLSGDATGSVEFDGSEDKTLNVTLSNSGVTAGTYGNSTEIPVITVNSKGQVTDAASVTADFLSASEKGVPGGVPFLGPDGVIPMSQLPPMYGVAQVILDKSSSRAVSTPSSGTQAYINTEPRPITVYVSGTSSAANSRLVASFGSSLETLTPASTSYAHISGLPVAVTFNVPAGAVYSVMATDVDPASVVWREYRSEES